MTRLGIRVSDTKRNCHSSVLESEFKSGSDSTNCKSQENGISKLRPGRESAVGMVVFDLVGESNSVVSLEASKTINFYRILILIVLICWFPVVVSDSTSQSALQLSLPGFINTFSIKACPLVNVSDTSPCSALAQLIQINVAGTDKNYILSDASNGWTFVVNQYPPTLGLSVSFQSGGQQASNTKLMLVIPQTKISGNATILVTATAQSQLVRFNLV